MKEAHRLFQQRGSGPAAKSGAYLLGPSRFATMVDKLLERREEWKRATVAIIAERRKRAAEVEAKLKRLCEAIENGVVDVSDVSLKEIASRS